jgi:hypothetical protein
LLKAIHKQLLPPLIQALPIHPPTQQTDFLNFAIFYASCQNVGSIKALIFGGSIFNTFKCLVIITLLSLLLPVRKSSNCKNRPCFNLETGINKSCFN